MIELYLTQYIEDRRTSDGKLLVDARKPKSQDEVRQTLYADVIKNWENFVATDVTRQDIIDLIMSIVKRSTNVQAGSIEGIKCCL